MSEDRLFKIKKQLASGNNQWLEDLYLNYKSYCTLTVISKFNISKDEANGIFSEALLIIYKNLMDGKMTSLKSEKTYLTSICVNLGRNRNYYIANEQRKENDIRTLFYRNNDNDDDQEDQDFKDELWTKCTEAIGELGEKCQIILKAFYLDNLTMKEIADLLDLKNADVAKTLKRRCYKRLLERIERKKP